MKLGAIPENPLEWGLLHAGLMPTPLLDTILALLLARSVMVGVKLGVFESLVAGPLPTEEIAALCDVKPQALEKLLGALAGAGYLRFAQERYRLSPVARRWLLKNARYSLYDAILLQFVDARFIEHMETFIRTGEPVHIHDDMSSEEWALYQRGMRSGANLAAAEMARRVHIPAGASTMLDIGGAHGHYSVAFCRRYPVLQATILDLPQAVEHAAPLLAQEGMGQRVIHRSGDALTADLGENTYDVVLVANLIHHFSAETNQDLMRRIALALRPGGIVIIGDMVRPKQPGDGGQIGALTDLYFAITSESGTWSLAEMAGWQRAAGLRPRRPLRLLTGPGAALQIAVKPRAKISTSQSEPV